MTKPYREALDEANEKVEDARLNLEYAQAEVARLTESLTEAMRNLVAAEKAEADAMHEMEYAYEMLQDDEIAKHEQMIHDTMDW